MKEFVALSRLREHLVLFKKQLAGTEMRNCLPNFVGVSNALSVH